MAVPVILDGVILPNYISQDSTFYYEFRTDITDTMSGVEQRLADWDNFRFSGDISSAIVDKTILDEIISMFVICKGRSYGFRVLYEPDYLITAGQIGIGDDNETEFQLVKRYSFGGYVFDRPCYKIFGTTKIYFDDVEQGAGWSVNNTTGIVTFISAPGLNVVITADFTFHYPMRFDVDKLTTQWKTYLVGEAKLPLIEVR